MAFKPHIGICICHGEKRIIVVKAGYCQRGNHEKKQAAKGDKAKKHYLPPVSDKRAKEQRVYSIARKLFLKHHPLCQAKVAGICQVASAEVHHKKGRIGELYLDQQYWLAVCSTCHKHVETHPEEAKEKGWSLDRLSDQRI